MRSIFVIDMEQNFAVMLIKPQVLVGQLFYMGLFYSGRSQLLCQPYLCFCKEVVASNILRNQYFNLPLPTSLFLEFVRLTKSTPYTFFQSQSFRSITRQTRKMSLKCNNYPFDFLSRQVCSIRRGTGFVIRSPLEIDRNQFQTFVYLAFTCGFDRKPSKEID